MKTFEFLCGGDYGAWESTVSVKLNDDQEKRMKAFAAENEFLDWSDSVIDIYRLVLKALDEQCDDFDPETTIIRMPVGLRDDGL